MALIDALSLPEKLRAAAFVLVAIANDFRDHDRYDPTDTPTDDDKLTEPGWLY